MTTLTPDEVETGRRDMIAKLRYEYADGRIPEITLDADMIRDLVALLEALKPVVVDREAVRQLLHQRTGCPCDLTYEWAPGLPQSKHIRHFDSLAYAIVELTSTPAALYPKATEGKS